MGDFTDKIIANNLSLPLRIWTDYERMNKTHFRSEIAKSWWSFDIENESHTWGYWRMLSVQGRTKSHFLDSVLCDGKRKLINTHGCGSCICTSMYQSLGLKLD